MSSEVLNLRQAAEHVHMDVNDLRHAAQRGEIAADEHGGDWYFRHRDLDEWAQRNFLAAGEKEQVRQHQVILDEHRRAKRTDWRIWELFRPEGVDLALPPKAKAGARSNAAYRDLTARNTSITGLRFATLISTATKT